MSTAPLLSVLTPTYQCAHLLPRTYEALKKQTHQNWEWLLIDDGSTDDTQTLVEGWNDPRIRYHRFATNKGRGAARNHGVGQARGKFIAVWDADDFYMPQRFEVCLAALEADPSADFACHYTGILSENLNFKGMRTWLKDEICGKYFVHHTLVAKTAVLQAHNYNPKQRVAEDAKLVYRLSLFHTGIFIDELLGFYDEQNNISPQKALRANAHILKGVFSLYHEKKCLFSSRLCLFAAKQGAKILLLALMCCHAPWYAQTLKYRAQTQATLSKKAATFIAQMKDLTP